MSFSTARRLRAGVRADRWRSDVGFLAMGVTIFRPGQGLYIPGVTVMQTRPSAAANWWDVAGQTCVAAYAPKGAASLAASYVNLTGNATYNAAPGVAPTLDADGWVFNGSTQYLNTGIAINSAGWSAIVRYSNATDSGDRCAIGAIGASEGARFYLSVSTTPAATRYYGYAALYGPGVALSASGVMALCAGAMYFDGASDGAISSTWSGTSAALRIGCRNNNGSNIWYYNAKIQALAVYSTTLSAGDVATLTTAMNAL